MLRIIFISTIVAMTVAEIPSYLPVCGRNNPDLNNCVKNSVLALRGKLREGIPELEVPSIDPLPIKFIELANADNFKIVAQDVNLYGLSNLTIQHFHMDLEKQTADIDLIFKKIRLTANYDVNTRILVPVSGKGPIDILADDVGAKAHLKFTIVDHKGSNYFFFSSMTVKLLIKDYISKFTPEDDANSALAEAVNAVLNGDRQEIIRLINPNLEKAIVEVVLDLANKITKNITYDEALPDRE